MRPGGKGTGAKRHGKAGDDLVLTVPPGTGILDDGTGEQIGEKCEKPVRGLARIQEFLATPLRKGGGVEGALFGAGDFHAAMGDGEIVICGAETPGQFHRQPVALVEGH